MCSVHCKVTRLIWFNIPCRCDIQPKISRTAVLGSDHVEFPNGARVFQSSHIDLKSLHLHSVAFNGTQAVRGARGTLAQLHQPCGNGLVFGEASLGGAVIH